MLTLKIECTKEKLVTLGEIRGYTLYLPSSDFFQQHVERLKAQAGDNEELKAAHDNYLALLTSEMTADGIYHVTQGDILTVINASGVVVDSMNFSHV